MKKIIAWFFAKYSEKVFIEYEFIKDTTKAGDVLSSVSCRFVVLFKGKIIGEYYFNSAVRRESAMNKIPNTGSAFDAFKLAQNRAIIMALSVCPTAIIEMDNMCIDFIAN